MFFNQITQPFFIYLTVLLELGFCLGSSCLTHMVERSTFQKCKAERGVPSLNSSWDNLLYGNKVSRYKKKKNCLGLTWLK